MPPYCPNCGKRIPRESDTCLSCGWDESQPVAAPPQIPAKRKVIQRSTVRIIQDDPVPVYLEQELSVVVTKVELGIGDLAVLMVKIAIAAIPASIIIALLYVFVFSVLLGSIMGK